jgi:hypothetical protein
MAFEAEYEGTVVRFAKRPSDYMAEVAVEVADVMGDAAEMYLADIADDLVGSLYDEDTPSQTKYNQLTRTFAGPVEIDGRVFTAGDEGAKGRYEKTKKIVARAGTLEDFASESGDAPRAASPREERRRRREERRAAKAPARTPQPSPAQPVARPIGDPLGAKVESLLDRVNELRDTVLGVKSDAAHMDSRAIMERGTHYANLSRMARLLEIDRNVGPPPGEPDTPADQYGASLRLNRMDAETAALRQDNDDILIALALLYRAMNVDPTNAVKVIMARRDIHL